MFVITGGRTNNVEYSCMYDASDIVIDSLREKGELVLLGLHGIAESLNDAPAILWFDENLNFVEGELL